MDPVVRYFAFVIVMHAGLVGAAVLGGAYMIVCELRRQEKP